jgi:hypothetical protein
MNLNPHADLFSSYALEVKLLVDSTKRTTLPPEVNAVFQLFSSPNFYLNPSIEFTTKEDRERYSSSITGPVDTVINRVGVGDQFEDAETDSPSFFQKIFGLIRTGFGKTKSPIDFLCDSSISKKYFLEHLVSSEFVILVYITSNEIQNQLAGIIFLEESRRRPFLLEGNVLRRANFTQKFLYISTICATNSFNSIYKGLGVRLIDFSKELSKILRYDGLTLEALYTCRNANETTTNCSDGNYLHEYYSKRGFEFDAYRNIMIDFKIINDFRTFAPMDYKEFLKFVVLENLLDPVKEFDDVVYEKQSDKKWKRSSKKKKHKIITNDAVTQEDLENIVEKVEEFKKENPNVLTIQNRIHDIDTIQNTGSFERGLIPMILYNNVSAQTNFGLKRYIQKKNGNVIYALKKYYRAMSIYNDYK